jgi:hypothetical protein
VVYSAAFWRKPITGTVTIENPKYLSDGIKITDKHTFSESSNKNYCTCKNLGQYRYCLIIWNI